jgi:general nucleoside transport system permease protein
MNWRGSLEVVIITLLALSASLVLFCLFIMTYTAVAADRVVMPGELCDALFKGGFGTRRAVLNALKLAAPIILTALCTALPARLGLVIIGGEGALIGGGLAAAVVGLSLRSLPAPLPVIGMMLVGMAAGAALIGLAGFLSHWRGVNATISSLLITYIVLGVFNYLVEGPLRDPASTNKPSTVKIAEEPALGNLFGLEVHWGLAFGLIACAAAYVLMDHTTFGFGVRMTGGNARAARAAGLPVGRLILITCLLGGAAAGLAGAVEIAASPMQANSGLYAAHYGYTGILVAFLARQQPLAIPPVALLFGGLKAASQKLQYLHLPDASVDVLSGIVFVLILLSETLYGRFRVFQPREHREQPLADGAPAQAAVPTA